MLSLLQEKRPLKRSRLGPPDVYPQEAKQREDELTPTNVKHGFATTPPLADEFGTAHNSNMNANKVGSFINSILSKKEELMTLQDTIRKKQQINCKDNFWPVSPRTKTALDAWFKDLAGNKPLLSLAKKAPSFNKKEEIFIILCDNQVNMQRAAWFIKLSAAYTVSFTESKNKKRSIYDPAVEWTGNIIKFMKELLPKLHEYFQLGTEKNIHNTNNTGSGMALGQIISPPAISSPVAVHSPLTMNTTSCSPFVGSSSSVNSSSGAQCGGSGSPISGIGSSFEDCRNALKYWKYCTRLCKYMHEESLLDRQEFLNWILELIEKMRSQISFDMSLKKLVLVFALQYMPDFVQSERLSRKLAVLVAKNLSQLLELNAESFSLNKTDISLSNMEVDNVEENKFKSNTVDSCLIDCINCPHHRDIVLYLSTILQTITLECPTALIWNGINESRASSSLCGSPLDFIPLVPSQFPMPFKCENSNHNIRRQLQIAETEIALRSKHAERRWFAEKWRSSKVNSFTHVLNILDNLDTHCFDRSDKDNNIDILYAKIFPPYDVKRDEAETKSKSKTYNPANDAATVKILCEWAVSNQRWGEHRAVAVAILLDKRQIEVTSASDNDQQQNTNGSDEKDSINSGVGLIGGLPVFQSVLMDFLDRDAPVLDENGSNQNRTQFINLVHLFSSLIRFDVFSHNAYMHTLISRGDLLRENFITELDHVARNEASSVCGADSVDNKHSPTHNFDDEFTSTLDFKHSEFDDSNVDDDLGKLLQNIKEKGQQSALETPDSPKIADSSNPNLNETLISRHYIYTKHFPIPQDETCVSYSNECNQRYILLFGVGKERDEKKHAVKKMSKEICKLFSKKFSIDVAEGGKVKKHSRNEFNFEATTSKCKSMSYFEQHVVTSQCAMAVLEQLNGFAIGNNNYLPVQEHVAFLFDLMEMALNIHSLLDFCDHILKELPEVENQLQSKKSILVRSYTTSLALYVVGILRRYHSCLLLSTDETISVFEGLCKTIKHVNNPKECSSAERCILAYLSDLYEMSFLVKSKETETEYFPILAVMKVFKDLYNSPEQLSPVPQSYNPHFLQELFVSPRRGAKIEYHCIRQLQESTINVYSFVSNAILAVCRENDNDHLNEIAILCAELTAACNTLSEEWIAALQSLCNASKKLRYPHLFEHVDVHDSKVHNSLAVFICILVARHCFSLADFVLKFALPTLANAYPVGGEFTPGAEAGARLTCHLVLKLFKTIEIPQPRMYSVSTSPNPINMVEESFNIKLSCDRHLLVGAHKNIPIQAVLAVIKAILIVVDLKTPTVPTSSTSAINSGKRSGVNTPVHPGSTPKSSDRPADLSQILGTSDLSNVGSGIDHDISQPNSGSSSAKSLEQVSLLEFANHVLKQICSQEHVLERCLKHADNLCEMIIDDMLTTKQVQRVLYMICYPEAEYNIISDMDQRSMIIRILENLEQWTLRISWLDLELMYRQIMNNQTELNSWLDTVAKAAIDVFQKDALSSDGNEIYHEKQSTWLIVPLVSKLTPAVKGRILRVAGRALESMNFFAKAPKTDNSGISNGDERERNVNATINHTLGGFNTSTSIKKCSLNYQPFLGLILSCLNGQDEHKESLLVSLYSQLSHCLQSFTEHDSSNGFNDPLEREEMLDALQLRFSLVGGMFETIQKNGTSTTDWAILLAQLVCQGVIDASSNRELFTTVVDMLVTLVHSTLVTENHSERDENKKLYLNLMKKLKKEIGEKNNASIKVIRQLLPLYKQTTEVISCEPAGVDMKGNKICDMDKKQLRISDKQRISVWDILEGHKNPAPLSWVWFGAVKSERKCLSYEETHRSLKYHAHSLVKPLTYFYESLPLPPEDLDPVPEKICIKDEMKPDTPSSVDQSPSAVTSGRGRGKGTTRKRKPKVAKTSPTNITAQPQMAPQPQQSQVQQQTSQQINTQNQINPMQMNTQVNVQQFNSNPMLQQNSGVMMQQQMQGNIQQINNAQNNQIGFMGNVPQGVAQLGGQNQQQWMGQNQYHPIQQQSQFYPHQTNRFERPQLNPSKQAICNMLRQRHPTFNQGNSSSFNAMQQQQHQQQIRQTQGLQAQGPIGSVPQQFVRGGMRGMSTNQNQLTNAINGVNMAQGVNQNSIMTPQQVNAQNINSQTNNQSMTMTSNAGIINTSSNNQSNLMNVQNTSGLVGSGNVMQQNLGSANANQNIINQGANPFHNFNQYQQQGMMNSGGNAQVPTSNMVAAYNQMGQRGNSSEYLQQRGVNTVNNGRGQFVNPTPNVTMGNMVGQNTISPYSRQQTPSGKPGVVSSQQQFQQQRIHHQMMQIQGGMVQSQNQNINQQQTPNLVAQLQRQLPNQQNMPVQQYQHHQPPY